MKWIPISKAKVKFDSNYLVATPENDPVVAKLHESKVTSSGVQHTFKTKDGQEITATHVAILTDPSAPVVYDDAP